MSYQSTVTEIRTAAEAVNPHGRFMHGRHVDLSQDAEGCYPVIYLYPITTNRATDPEFIDSHNLTIGFWMEDKPDSSNEDRENIIAKMDQLSDEFLLVLEELRGSRISNVQKEPQYQMYQGTLSGYAIRLTYQNFTAC